MKNKAFFKELAAAMESENFDISTPARKKIFESWYRRGETYLIVLLGLGCCALFAWCVYPLVDDLDYNLSVKVSLPYDYEYKNTYELSFVFVEIVFTYCAFFVMSNDLIIQAHLMQLLCQFSVLDDCFKNIAQECTTNEDFQYGKLNVNEAWKEKYINRLRSLVAQHSFILSNTMKLRDILSSPLLCQFLASGILICFTGYQATTTINTNVTKFLMSLFYLGYNLFELYIFCRWCDEIKIHSENIADAVYSSGWEGGAASLPGVRARLMIVIARARKPLVLTAGGLYDLSLASYSTLLKTSYSALTVLLRM